LKEDEQKFEQLKKLLLHNEQTILDEHQEGIADLRAQLKNFEENFPVKSKEQMEELMADFKKRFPDEFKSLITKSIKNQVRESQDEMVEALHPIIGKLIKKFIRKEIEKISEDIDTQVNTFFTVDGLKRWFNTKIRGVDYSKQILQDKVSAPIVKQIFLLDSESAILLGSYSTEDTVDEDLVSAMLSAITDFVEDALQTEKEHLEWLEYETHKLHVKSIGKADIAFVIDGNPHADFKSELEDKIFEFAEKGFKEDLTEEEFGKVLAKFFDKFTHKK
jgi:hypothetical protein